MSDGLSRESHAAEQVRRRLAWLSSEQAAVRLMGYTRSLTPAEHAHLAAIEAESTSLLRTLDRLTTDTISMAPSLARRAAGLEALVAA